MYSLYVYSLYASIISSNDSPGDSSDTGVDVAIGRMRRDLFEVELMLS